MSTCRQNMSIWRYIFPRIVAGRLRWRVSRLFNRNYWQSRHVWHDSFGRYWNRLIGCRIRGHKNIRYLSDGGCSNDRPIYYCFACERQVEIYEEELQNNQGRLL